MPELHHVELRVNGNNFDIPVSEDLPVSINFNIEGDEDFRQKKPADALNITVPATLDNAKGFQALSMLESVDTMPADSSLDKPYDVVLKYGGEEIVKGKGFTTHVRELSGKPLNFDINVFGDNADWIIPNKELTLQDVMNTNTHTFDKATIEASWLYDGTDPDLDYVYAPVRYQSAFGQAGDNADEICRLVNLKPALSAYWMLYRGFKAAGYRMVGEFADTEYFRRMVLPWTWDDFLYVEVNALMCKANMPGNLPPAGSPFTGAGGSGIKDLNVSDDAILGFDNGVPISSPIGCYNYDPIGKTMNWFYLSALTPSPGTITGNFSVKIFTSWQLTVLINAQTIIKFYLNGSVVQTTTLWSHTGTNGSDEQEVFCTVTGLVPTDTVSATFEIQWGAGAGSGSNVSVEYVQFKTNYFRLQDGSTVDFSLRKSLKEYKWLDMLRGIIDMFNLQLNTDPFAKTVTIEPTHNYSLNSDFSFGLYTGWYNGKVLDWREKLDLSQVKDIEIFQDYEREVIMKLQNDSNDGMLKLLSDRYHTDLSQCKYLFPERFKKGVNTFENRFFSTVIHCKARWWSGITGIEPQLICIIPENISQTSSSENKSTVAPKLAYYKGLVDKDTYGGWNWDGDTSLDFPLMFAVLYMPGGIDEPILTYCDQKIPDGSNGFNRGAGLFRRFYLQRFAIMRRGKLLNASFMLNNTDVLNGNHREFKLVDTNLFQLIQINGYRPYKNVSTPCRMWLWHPVEPVDIANIFPSNDSIMAGTVYGNTPDIVYSQCMATYNDVARFTAIL